MSTSQMRDGSDRQGRYARRTDYGERASGRSASYRRYSPSQDGSPMQDYGRSRQDYASEQRRGRTDRDPAARGRMARERIVRDRTDYGRTDYSRTDYGRTDYSRTDYGRTDYSRQDPERLERERRARAARNMREGSPSSVRSTSGRNRSASSIFNMTSGFVLFIGIVVALLVACSVYYIRLKAEYTELLDDVAALDYELTEARNENDAFEAEVTSGADLDRIRQIAIAQLGMKTPSEDQIRYYSISDEAGYVRQYQDIVEEE